jgi:hypothetical protein
MMESDLITTAQHWRYSSNNDGGDIELDKRLEFFEPEHFHQEIGSGVSTSEMLMVDSRGSKLSIILHPDSDCVYKKVD